MINKCCKVSYFNIMHILHYTYVIISVFKDIQWLLDYGKSNLNVKKGKMRMQN